MKDLIHSYRFCPQCGSEDYARQPGPQRECRQCGHRDFNNPISGVAALVTAGDGDMLWIRRGREPGKGLLGMPGGFVDPGEGLEEALHREVLEETDISITKVTYLGSYPNTYVYRGYGRPVCDTFFTANTSRKTCKARPGEVEECLWLRPENVDPESLAFPSMRQALTAYLQKWDKT